MQDRDAYIAALEDKVKMMSNVVAENNTLNDRITEVFSSSFLPLPLPLISLLLLFVTHSLLFFVFSDLLLVISSNYLHR